jgi:predicted NAD-dependent protein-ADP-ribosyltransferase YbiA (DUF1768 family)
MATLEQRRANFFKSFWSHAEGNPTEDAQAWKDLLIALLHGKFDILKPDFPKRIAAYLYSLESDDVEVVVHDLHFDHVLQWLRLHGERVYPDWKSRLHDPPDSAIFDHDLERVFGNLFRSFTGQKLDTLNATIWPWFVGVLVLGAQAHPVVLPTIQDLQLPPTRYDQRDDHLSAPKISEGNGLRAEVPKRVLPNPPASNATRHAPTTQPNPPSPPSCPLLEPRALQWRKAPPSALIAFYYPGKDTAWDVACQARFLSNFFDVECFGQLIEMNFKSLGTYSFRNAEAAFQATKYYDTAAAENSKMHIQLLSRMTGSDAFSYKNTHRTTRGYYGRYANNYEAMWAVLQVKFRIPQLREALVKTQSAFLLEHNQKSGVDDVWSDNFDGTGQNLLGLQLMLLREEITQHTKYTWLSKLQNLANVKKFGATPSIKIQDLKWTKLVKEASDFVRQHVSSLSKYLSNAPSEPPPLPPPRHPPPPLSPPLSRSPHSPSPSFVNTAIVKTDKALEDDVFEFIFRSPVTVQIPDIYKIICENLANFWAYAISTPRLEAVTLESIEKHFSPRSSTTVKPLHIVTNLNVFYFGRGKPQYIDNSILQVASQFNFLESPSTEYTPPSKYFRDQTQGPVASLSFPGMLVQRDCHFRKKNIQDIFRKFREPIYKGGYFMPYAIPTSERNEALAHIKTNIGKLKILAQSGKSFWERNDRTTIQVFTAAPSFQNSSMPSMDSADGKMCDILVSSQYAALGRLAALQSLAIKETVRLHLTLLGQGVFQNPEGVLTTSFTRLLDAVKGYDVEVFVHAYSDGDKKKTETALMAAAQNLTINIGKINILTGGNFQEPA